MLSLILYGRNDSYGYNLHKRAAISLNCMAEVLTDPEDEIIFVDYNTPDDFPTFPEAIQDTLTDRVKALLRILRVRPSQHERFRDQTNLRALEPISRNVAIRRSNPNNRWVLSTNTDMVFVPRRATSVSEIAATLDDGYYHLPRFELPETLWESLNRQDPVGTIEAIRTWGTAFHLNEVVFSSDPTVRYDAPGDFQLILRSDLWEMHGYHESMLLGWHVDSNMAKRLFLLPRQMGNIVHELFGYHCDHTRQVTPAHRPRAAENDLQVFFADVTSAQIPEQAQTWGLAGEHVEELKLNATSRTYLAAVGSAIRTPLAAPTEISYSIDSHNEIDYSIDHVLPFLADIFASYRRDTILGWLGAKRTLLLRFAEVWKSMGFTEPIIDLNSDVELQGRCHVFVFDWGVPDNARDNVQWRFRSDPAIRTVLRGFRRIVRHERDRQSNGNNAPRRFIGINAVNNDVEGIFHENVGAARTPIATRIRQGYVSSVRQRQDLIRSLNAGDAGRKVRDVVVTRSSEAGFIFYGPYLALDSGDYRLILEFNCTESKRSSMRNSGFVLELLSGSCMLGYRTIEFDELERGIIEFQFNIPAAVSDAQDWPKTEFRLRTLGLVQLVLSHVWLETNSQPAGESAETFDLDLLPVLAVGDAGSYEDAPPAARREPTQAGRVSIRAKRGVADFVVYGPHIWLLPGRYEATFDFFVEDRAAGAELLVEVVTHLGKRILADDFVALNRRGRLARGLSFDVGVEEPPSEQGLLEFRVWSPGNSSFSLRAVRVRAIAPPYVENISSWRERPVSEQVGARRMPIARRVQEGYLAGRQPQDLLWAMQIGIAGQRVSDVVVAKPNVSGFVAHGPYIWLSPGRYEVTFKFYARRIGRRAGIKLEVAVRLGEQILAERFLRPEWWGRRRECVLAFDVRGEAPAPHEGLLEFRVWTSGRTKLILAGLHVRQVAVSAQTADEMVPISP
jgi:hypothetical protein